MNKYSIWLEYPDKKTMTPTSITGVSEEEALERARALREKWKEKMLDRDFIILPDGIMCHILITVEGGIASVKIIGDSSQVSHEILDLDVQDEPAPELDPITKFNLEG